MEGRGDTIEQIGARIVRRVLEGDDVAIVDLRAQRGVGIDRLEDLGQFYELKVFSGSEPDVIHLTQGDADRAHDANFFVVVTSGVGDGPEGPVVRVIAPQGFIRTSDREGTHVPVHSAPSLVFRPSAS